MRLIRSANRCERRVLWTARAVALAFPVAYLCLLVVLLVGKPKTSGVLIAPLIGFVTDGKVMLDSDGKVVLNADGTVRLANGSNDFCNCTCDCGACGQCNSATPSAYIVTLTGVTICNVPCQVFGTQSTLTEGSINGTYTCYCCYPPGPGCSGQLCQWLTHTSGFRLRRWSNTTCGGTLLDDVTTGRLIILRGAGPRPTTFQQILYQASTFNGGTATFFDSGDLLTADCLTSITGTANGAACIGGTTGFHNGTADMSVA